MNARLGLDIVRFTCLIYLRIQDSNNGYIKLNMFGKYLTTVISSLTVSLAFCIFLCMTVYSNVLPPQLERKSLERKTGVLRHYCPY